MKVVGDLDIFRAARQMPSLMGVELQITAVEPDLWDLDTVRRYKREAQNWGIQIPLPAGVWSRGISRPSRE